MSDFEVMPIGSIRQMKELEEKVAALTQERDQAIYRMRRVGEDELPALVARLAASQAREAKLRDGLTYAAAHLPKELQEATALLVGSSWEEIDTSALDARLNERETRPHNQQTRKGTTKMSLNKYQRETLYKAFELCMSGQNEEIGAITQRQRNAIFAIVFESAEALLKSQPQTISLPPPGTEEIPWIGCGECDKDFSCHDGRGSCVRLIPIQGRKVGGSFQHTGKIVAQFETTAGEDRVVFEFDAPVKGMLHVYRPDQIEIVENHVKAEKPNIWKDISGGHGGHNGQYYHECNTCGWVEWFSRNTDPNKERIPCPRCEGVVK